MGGKWHAAGLVVVLLAMLVVGGAAYGTTAASATISSQQLSPSSWEYSLTLQNTGTTTINTFWTAWIVYFGLYPYDLLPSHPTSVQSPSGWAGQALNESPYSPGHWGVEWTSATGLAPGQSLSGFVFDSPDSPAVVNGTSFFAGYPVRESWVYHGASQSEAGFELAPTIVAAPEPAIALLLPSLVMLAGRRFRA